MLRPWLFSTFVCFLITEKAYAYFDPGTGSILIQLLLALIGGVIVFYHRIVFKIKNITKIILPSSKIKHIISSRHRHYYLASTIGVFAALFYASHNVSYLTTVSFLFNMFLFVLTSVLFSLLFHLALRKRKNREQILHAMLFLLLFFYMQPPIYQWLQFLSTVFLYPWLLFLVLYLGYKLYNNTHKIIVVIVIASFLPTYKLVKGVYIRMPQKTVATTDKRIIFQHKPNVYFFLFDSYTNAQGMKVIGLAPPPHDTNVISQRLQEKGYTLYPDFFTNFQSTRFALTSYMSMDVMVRDKSIYHMTY